MLSYVSAAQLEISLLLVPLRRQASRDGLQKGYAHLSKYAPEPGGVGKQRTFTKQSVKRLSGHSKCPTGGSKLPEKVTIQMEL